MPKNNYFCIAIECFRLRGDFKNNIHDKDENN